MFLLVFLFEVVLARSTYNRRQQINLERAFSNFIKKYSDDGHSSNEITVNNLPNWMHHLRADLAEKTLNEIFIPGAHDAAMNTGGSLFKAQLLSIRGLLDAGVRFLDLRIRMKTDRQLVTYHHFAAEFAHGGSADSVLLENAMDQIYQFLITYPGEIVIVKIKPDIALLQKNIFENAVMNTIPQNLRDMMLPNNVPINQKYQSLITSGRRFIVIYEKTGNQRTLTSNFLFSNKDKTFMYSNAPLASNYNKLITGLQKKLPTPAETACRISLFHWTITTGNIYENTLNNLNNKNDFQNKVWHFIRRGKRVNVVMMDFCSSFKSTWIVEMNEHNFVPPQQIAADAPPQQIAAEVPPHQEPQAPIAPINNRANMHRRNYH